MKIKFEGKAQINAPLDLVMKFLADMKQISSCIPDSQNFKKVGEKNFTADITVRMAGINSVFAITGEMVNHTANHMEYAIDGRGIGSTAKIILHLDINPKDTNTTEIIWHSESDLHGIVNGLSEPILRKVSEDKINEMIARVKASIEDVYK